MRNRARKLYRLNKTDRTQLIRAYVWLLIVDVLLRLVPLRRLLKGNDDVTDAPVTSEMLERSRTPAYWVTVASHHHFVQAHCLHRSLATHYLLRRDGLPSRVRIGVRKEEGALKAHAWVVLGDRVVNDLPEAVAPFVPLARASAASAFGPRAREFVGGYDAQGRCEARV